MKLIFSSIVSSFVWWFIVGGIIPLLIDKIDEIDTSLCQMIKERQSLASKIMNAKKGDFPFDPDREEKLIGRLSLKDLITSPAKNLIKDISGKIQI